MFLVKNLFSFFLALFLLPVLSSAQSFNPFPGAHTYTYALNHTSGSQLHSVRVDTTYQVGLDIVYEFNKTFRLNTSLDFLGGCGGVSQVPNYDYSVSNRFANQPSAFGHYMLSRPNGRYDFVDTLVQDTFRIETGLGVGNSWTVNPLRGLTATLDSMTYESFLGVADSVMHITLCNGKSFQLSKTHGALTLIPWLPVHHPGVLAADYPPQYELRGVDEISLGTPRATFEDIYDFGTNDKFQFFVEYRAGLWDSYDQYVEYLVQNWGVVPTGMGGDWTEEKVVYSQLFNVPDTTYTAPTLLQDTFTSTFDGQDIGALAASTTFAYDSLCGGNCSVVILENTHLEGGRTQYEFRRFRCSGNNCYPDDAGWKANWKFREGLGKTYIYTEIPFGADTETLEIEMICYQTSWGSGGTCVNFSSLVTGIGAEGWDEEVQAWQDQEQLRVRLPAGIVKLRLIGLDGRIVWTEDRDRTPGEVRVSLPWLAKGLYVLEARGTNDRLGRKKVIWR